jgi:hypothetical protein
MAGRGSGGHASLGLGSAQHPTAASAAARDASAPQAPDPMHASFMMLDLSNSAPVSAAVAWLLFGAILGAVSVRIAREGT